MMHSRTSVRRGMSLDCSAAISSCVRRDDFLALDFTAPPLGCDTQPFSYASLAACTCSALCVL